MVLFKLVSLLVSIDIYFTSMASSDMNESNYFDLFFYGYAACDFSLSIVGIVLMALRFLLMADFLVAGARLNQEPRILEIVIKMMKKMSMGKDIGNHPCPF